MRSARCRGGGKRRRGARAAAWIRVGGGRSGAGAASWTRAGGGRRRRGAGAGEDAWPHRDKEHVAQGRREEEARRWVARVDQSGWQEEEARHRGGWGKRNQCRC